MLDLTESADMASNRNVEGRVGEHHVGAIGSHQQAIALLLERTPAQDAVDAQDPDVARHSDFRAGVGQSGGLVIRLVEIDHHVDLPD